MFKDSGKRTTENLKIDLNFSVCPNFQHTLRLLLLHVNYIQLQRKSNDFLGLTIKTKKILVKYRYT